MTTSNSKNRIVLALDSHLVSYYQACPRKFWNIYFEHLVSRRTVSAYEIGTMIHEIMRRITRAKLAKNYTGHRRQFTDIQLLEIGYRIIRRAKCLQVNGDPAKTQENIIFHVAKFTEFYAWRKHQERFMKPVGCEVGFSKVIYENNDILCLYEGRIDEILRVQDAENRNSFLAWVDYKSQSREYAIYENRNQLLGYSWALNTTMGYICYYGLQKEKKDPHRYKAIFHNANLIKQWQCDTIQTFREIITHAPFGIEQFRRNRFACDAGSFGNCQFTKLCDNAWAGSEITEGLKRTFYKIEEWKPW